MDLARICLCALALVALTTRARAADLDITVTGVRNDNGMIDICVASKPDHFPDCAGDASAVTRRVAASIGRIHVAVLVAPGVYAVSVLHDENGNGRMDTNFFGIPREGGGVSNNPPARLGPPRFDDARFAVPPQGAAITISMVYP